MAMPINRAAYRYRLDQDIKWLRRTALMGRGDANEGPASDLGHIIMVLNWSEGAIYDEAPTAAPSLDEKEMIGKISSLVKETHNKDCGNCLSYGLVEQADEKMCRWCEDGSE